MFFSQIKDAVRDENGQPRPFSLLSGSRPVPLRSHNPIITAVNNSSLDSGSPVCCREEDDNFSPGDTTAELIAIFHVS